MKPTAFHIPTRSVMAGAKPHKPVTPSPINHINVVGKSAGRAETDRRHAMRKAAI